MANKNIQIKDMQGNLVFPKTLASIVLNNNNENLGGVEAGAQVNKIEKIKLNGVELSIASKEVDIQLPAAAEYSIAKQATADEGFAATYYLTKDGTQVGEKINIMKDQVLKNVELKVCAKNDEPVVGFKKGDYYFEFTFQNKETPIYLNAKNLMDIYEGGNGITVTGNSIAIDTSVVATQSDLSTGLAGKQDSLSDAQLNAVNSGITAEKVSAYDGYASTIAGKQEQLSETQLAAANSGVTAAKVSGYDTHVANADIHVTAAQKSEWSGKQAALSEAQLAAANSGVTATKVAGYDLLDGAKADKATTLAGYGITDGLTYEVLA